jgi:hypothetical protein
MDEANPRDVARQDDIEVAPAGSWLDKFKAKPRAASDPAVAKPRRQKRKDNFVQISRNQLAILRQGHATAAAWSVLAELIWLTWEE